MCAALISTGQPPWEWAMALLDLMRACVAERLRNTDPAADGGVMLTGRQREVLLCMARGMRNQDIASKLYLSVDDVKYHKAKL